MPTNATLAVSIATALREFELEVDLEVEAGSCLAIVGPSGAGKTTVLRAVAGLHQPDRGAIRLGSRTLFDAATRTDVPAEDRGCGYLFQEYALFPHLSAWRNVAFGLRNGSRHERHERAVALLERFDAGRLADTRPSELSGGERQRVALARAFARSPAALLLDEPLAALDATTAAAAGRELAALLRGIDVPTLLVTHDFADAALLADRIAVIDRGRIVQRGSPAELSARPASSFVADFAGASVMVGIARGGDGGLTIVELDGGGRVASTDSVRGRAAVAVYPWDVTLEPAGARSEGSALNHLDVTVTSVTVIGNRARVGLAAPAALAAEVTGASVNRLGLAPGVRAVATWKATATRLMPR
jgi:molybdate transport system ATP-binding protein